MRFFRLSNCRRRLTTCLLLVMLLLRAYVPTGFMPQSGSPLQLQVCPTGMPMHSMRSQAMHHAGTMAMEPAPGKHSTGTADHASDCPFGHSPVAGPVADGVVLSSVQPVFSRPLLAFDSRPAGTRSLRAHQARAPPTFA
ncbi:MAG: hypothetical protein ACHQIL_10340 [Steroidobacterales bacterium]